jgi:hypothetical protein
VGKDAQPPKLIFSLLLRKDFNTNSLKGANYLKKESNDFG